MKVKIQKSYSLCYGHRLWNQQSEPHTCRRRHGHLGVIDVALSADTAEMTRGMLLDFNELKPIKRWIDETIDHRFIMDVRDPLLVRELEILQLSVEHLEDQLINEFFTHWIVSRERGRYATEDLWELAQSLVVVPWEPTSENLAKWMLEVVSEMVPERQWVQSVRWWESPTSFAEVSR